MQIDRQDIEAATKAGLLTTDQAQQLWLFWEKEHEHVPHFRFVHIMYYFGGLLAISAVTLFVTQAWDKLLGIPLFIVAVGLFILGLLLTRYFINKKIFIPAGIMSTFSLAIVPLAIYNIEYCLGIVPGSRFHYVDYHFWINGYWVPMELGTLLVGAVLLYLYQFPFLIFLIAMTLWYMSMDLYALFFHMTYGVWQATFSMYFGLGMIAAAIYMDFKYDDQRQSYAFWLYIIGVIVFWGGLSCQESHSELSKFFYFVINIVMLLVSVILNRRVFAVFGALGILEYIGHLAFSIFKDSLSFPLVLVFMGILIILAATRWSAMERKLISCLHPYIPSKVLKRMKL